MNDEIIRMARKAGFENSEYGLNCTPGMYAYNMGIVERFAALVAAAEREECANEWEAMHGYDKYGVAAAIRARGQA